MEPEITLRNRIIAHKELLMLLFIAALLIFPHLGSNTLWNDEGDNAYWGLSIMKNGVPKAWDGRNFSYEDFNAMTDKLVMVTLPWLPLYATAASMTLFGETAGAVRLPFALAGWATVFTLYLLVWRTTRDKKAALTAGALLLLSVQFLIYTRSCRYYAFVMFFICLSTLLFLRIDRPRRPVFFAISTILLFYSLPLPALCLLASLALLTTCFHPFFVCRRGFWQSLLIIVPLTLPWIIWTGSRYSSSDIQWLASIGEVWPRFRQMLIESTIAVPCLGWLGLLFFLKKPVDPQQRLLLALCGTLMLSFVCSDILIHRDSQMYIFGLRHYAGIIPIGAAVSAVLITSVSRRRWWVQLILIIVLGATHLGGRSIPWVLTMLQKPAPKTAETVVMAHLPRNPLHLVLRGELAGYVLGLFRENPGTTSEIVRALDKHVPGDARLYTNYDWESIYFYTRLPLAGKIMPGDPVYPAARNQGVPDYVFDPSAADWIVWRPAWGYYLGSDKVMAALLQKTEAQGTTWRIVATIKETSWENRENLNYHRFPVLGYLYCTLPDYPDALLLHAERSARNPPTVAH